MNANDRNTKKSRAVGYGTFGRSVLASSPKNVIVKTVVIPEGRNISFPFFPICYFFIYLKKLYLLLLLDSTKMIPRTVPLGEHRDHRLVLESFPCAVGDGN